MSVDGVMLLHHQQSTNVLTIATHQILAKTETIGEIVIAVVYCATVLDRSAISDTFGHSDVG